MLIQKIYFWKKKKKIFLNFGRNLNKIINL